MEQIAIDLGFGHIKVAYKNKIAKFSTAICFASDVGMAYGEENIYEFEGDAYYIGKEAVGGETFATTDYKFLRKFSPLLIYYILHKFDKVNLDTPIIVKTGLSLTDWQNKEDFKERISNIKVNNDSIQIEPHLIPQGAGCAVDWVHNNNNGEYPDRLSVIDIGFLTINLVSFAEGKPVKKEMKSYPGHGVSSIIKPFTSFMENTFKVSFSEQEAMGIFIKGVFKYNGEVHEEVANKVRELKKQFVTKLFQSILVNDKKQLAMADVVIISGGGAYLLQDTPFPPNVTFSSAPMEFANSRGYLL